MSVSVIIPALNEAGCLADTIRSLQIQRPHEIIVVDGGSTDGTREAAAGATHFLEGPRGRAMQMNAGAALATGDVFLFLHADCTLEDGALAGAERSLRGAGFVAGCFVMQVRAPGLLFRLIDTCATARVRLTGIAYGDQGLFLRREQFQQLGGFPPLRFMEDLFFSRRLRQLGRVVVAPQRVFVSPRRWQQRGLIRQTLRNWLLTGFALAGVHPDRLAEFYSPFR
jgi:rSAM/selenodomain-associated transferase 2